MRLVKKIATLSLVLVAIWSGRWSLRHARGVWLSAHQWSDATSPEAENRLFGATFMRSVRSARSQFAIDDWVPFVDVGERGGGAPYFALYFLSPRKLAKLDRSCLASPRCRASLERGGVQKILLVGELGEPLRVESLQDVQ